MDYNDVISNAAVLQYPLAIAILFAIFALRKFAISNLVTYAIKPGNFIALGILLSTSVAGFMFGSSIGLEVNFKTIFSVAILWFILADKVDSTIYRWLYGLVLVLLVLEYLLAYSGLFDIHIERHLAIRPFGLFLDPHLSSLFICLALFTFGHKFAAAAVSLVMGSYQTTLAILFLFVASRITVRMVPILLVVVLVTYFALERIGHLSTNPDSISIVNVYLQSFTPYAFEGFDLRCFAIGCSSNISNSPMNYSLLADIGFVRVAYQYGLVWVIVLIYLLRRFDIRYVLAHLVASLAHYPVSFGVLGMVLMLLNLKYLEGKQSAEVSTSVKRSPAPSL